MTSPSDSPTAPPPGTFGTAADDRKFNDDLLCEQSDCELAMVLYPKIHPILDFPKLRKVFLKYDVKGNRARKWVRGLGLLSVVLATVALLASAIAPLLLAIQGVPIWVHYVLVSCEVAGLVGAAMATGGVWHSGWKKQWLESRLMTERLRQWHFQLLITRGMRLTRSKDVEAIPVGIQSMDEFLSTREVWLRDFLQESEGKLDSILHNLLERPEVGYEWLYEPSTPYTPDSGVQHEVFAAYRKLRLKHQADYVAYKLQRYTDQPFWSPLTWPAAVLENRTEAIASFCLLGALLVSCLIVVGAFVHLPLPAHVLDALLPGCIIALMIINVATRAVRDGWAIREETQRFGEYAGKTHYLLTRFDSTSGAPEQRLDIMKEMERAAVEELKGFLRAHSEAKFIL